MPPNAPVPGTLSATTNVFLNVAEELVTKLDAKKTPEAVAMAQQARQLAEIFRRWPLQRPLDEDRATTIRELLDLQRRAMEHLCSHQ